MYTVLCAASMIVATGLWLPFTWWRYFLPSLLLMAPLYAAGGAFLLSVAATRVPRGSSASQSAASPNSVISESVAPTTKLAGR